MKGTNAPGRTGSFETPGHPSGDGVIGLIGHISPNPDFFH